MDVLIEPVNNRFNPFFEDPILDEEEEEEEEEEELMMMMVTMVTMMMIMMLLLLIQRQRQQRHDNNNNNDNVMIRKRRRPHHQFGDYVEHMRLFQRRRVAGNKHTGFMFLNKVDYHTGTILAKNFRRLIGFSNHAFTELVRNARESRVNNGNGELVPRFIDETHSLKGRPIPISLEDKIICAIVYLKVGCSFKHLEATMMISASIQAIFFWKFTEWIATVKFGEMVRIPQNQAELDLLMAKYANLGFPGACGSMDATHFRANKIPANRRHQATKAQATYPTYVANFVFDPNGLVLSMSPVYYGATNDIILADAQDYVKELGTNPLFASAQYAMKDLDGNEIRETVAYFLCDGGYRQSRFLPNRTVIGFGIMSSQYRFRSSMHLNFLGCSPLRVCCCCFFRCFCFQNRRLLLLFSLFFFFTLFFFFVLVTMSSQNSRITIIIKIIPDFVVAEVVVVYVIIVCVCVCA